MPIEINGNLYLLRIGTVKLLKNFNCEKVNISDKIIKTN